MDNDRPAVSLVIPAFNEAAYLPRLLDSVEVARSLYRCGADQIEGGTKGTGAYIGEDGASQ